MFRHTIQLLFHLNSVALKKQIIYENDTELKNGFRGNLLIFPFKNFIFSFSRDRVGTNKKSKLNFRFCCRDYLLVICPVVYLNQDYPKSKLFRQIYVILIHLKYCFVSRLTKINLKPTQTSQSKKKSHNQVQKI